MDAKETKRRGIEYCKKHSKNDNPEKGVYCKGCPLDGVMCINMDGDFCGYFSYDFELFAKEFNFMINEIYKKEENK